MAKENINNFFDTFKIPTYQKERARANVKIASTAYFWKEMPNNRHGETNFGKKPILFDLCINPKTAQPYQHMTANHELMHIDQDVSNHKFSYGYGYNVESVLAIVRMKEIECFTAGAESLFFYALEHDDRDVIAQALLDEDTQSLHRPALHHYIGHFGTTSSPSDIGKIAPMIRKFNRIADGYHLTPASDRRPQTKHIAYPARVAREATMLDMSERIKKTTYAKLGHLQDIQKFTKLYAKHGASKELDEMDIKRFFNRNGLAFTRPDTPATLLENVTDFSTDYELFLHIGMVQNGIDSLARLQKRLENQRNIYKNNPPGPRGL